MITGDLQPGATVGEYQIDRSIGEGSFGKVYAATHPMIGKRAAIKVLGFEHSQSPQFVSRFLEEARAVNKIRHRNIVDIFSFGKLDDGRHYLVMELLEGKPMGDWLAERGSIPIAEALPVLRKVARALEAAHKHGIAHRDLKPDNVFLTFDEDGIVFPILLDFGIAKLMGDSPMGHKTQTGTPMGTPLYMSPEQCKGSHMDHHTDIYSFGIVVFEMLTGRRPFDSDNVMEILMSHLTATPPTMSSVNPAVPAALDPPIQRMLEKSPEARPPSITIAIEALIAAAKSIGISVPSSRNAAISGFGGTAPMPFGGGVQTVPDAPMDPNASVQPAGARALREVPRYETTKESPVYQAPPAVPAHTHADSSLKPVGAAVPPPPTRTKKSGGGLLFILMGIVALVLVVGGGLYAMSFGPSDTDETEEDEDEDDASDDEGRKSKKKTVKPSSVAPAPDDKDGVRFIDTVMRVGGVLESNESTVFTFTRVDGGTKHNIATTNNRVSRLEVVGADAAAVQRCKISFTKANESTSLDRGAPQSRTNPIEGQTYEADRQGAAVVVQKQAGALSNDERTDVERHVAGVLGPNILSSTLGGKTISVGERLDLPFATVLALLRETERMKFPKLTGSITLQKVVEQGGGRVGVFNAAISFHYKQDGDGGVFKSDMTGTLRVRLDTTWVTAFEMYGPLEIDAPSATTKFEPGTFNYGYTNVYP